MKPSSGGEFEPPVLPVVLPDEQDESDPELFYPHVTQIETDTADSGRITDFNLLKRLLAVIESKRDIERLAYRLFARFGSFSKIVTAPDEELSAIDGIGKRTMHLIKIIQHSAHRLIRADLTNEPILNQYETLKDYLLARLSHDPEEKFLALFLNGENRLLADEILGVGTVDHVDVSPRTILKRGLELHATAVILVHNHPSGKLQPSPRDLAMTRRMCIACSAVEIIVHDHVIVGNGEISSLKKQGLLQL